MRVIVMFENMCCVWRVCHLKCAAAGAAGDVGGDDNLHPVLRDEPGDGAVDGPSGGHRVHHVCARHVPPAAGPAPARDAARAPAAPPSTALPLRRLPQVPRPSDFLSNRETFAMLMYSGLYRVAALSSLLGARTAVQSMHCSCRPAIGATARGESNGLPRKCIKFYARCPTPGRSHLLSLMLCTVLVRLL